MNKQLGLMGRRAPVSRFNLHQAAIWLVAAVLLAPLAPVRANNSEAAASIRLQYATFDPLAGEPAVPAGMQVAIPQTGPATYLVQFAGPVRGEWKTAVENAGARLYGYVPDYAFIARMDAATAERVRGLPAVRWVGPYHPAYRLAPALTHQATRNTQHVVVTAQTLPDADLEALTQQVAAWGGRVQDQTVTAFAGYLRLELPDARLHDLAALDGVIWVEPYFTPTLDNDIGGGTIMRANDVRASLGLYGEGQIVAVADTGLDVGATGPAMSDDFEGRIVEGQSICAALGGRTTWNDFHSHGTHVAGSVLGSGANSGSNASAHQYEGSFAGVAPEAQLVFQAIDNDANPGLECLPLDMAGFLMGPAYALGARIHTNSWGGPTGDAGNPWGGYDAGAQAADLGAWTYPQMLILYAAGNNGVDADANGVIDADSLGSPGTAKNVLTVGASENVRPDTVNTWSGDDYPVSPINGDLVANNADGMAAFSSRGPTDDGRVKPDVTAPGTNIISARSHDPAAGTGWGVYNEHYLYMGGTSMATPLTAGAAALVREWYTDQGVVTPSGALLKATLINGAVDMSPGQYGTGATQEIPTARPNTVTGWGRVDLVATLNPATPTQIWYHDAPAGLTTGGQVSFALTLTAGRANDAPPPAPKAVEGPPPPKVALQLDGEATPFGFRPAAVSLPAAPGLSPSESGPLHPGSTNLLVNGGFETGDWAPWVPLGNSEITDQQHHSGSYSAWLAGYNNAADFIYQQVAVPSDAQSAVLDFWYRAYSTEVYAGQDIFCYDITDTGGSTLIGGSYCDDLYDTTPSQWLQAQHSLTGGDLAPLLGQNVLVWFYAQTNGSLYSSAWVDDAALEVTTGGGSEPTLTITPESGPRGASFAVAGSDFDINDSVTIAIDGVDQFDVSSDGSGAFAFNLTPPGTVTQGQHTVTATDTGGHDASDTFSIAPQVGVDVSPSSGDPGDSFAVTGSGFHGGSAITIKLDGVSLGTVTAATDGSFAYTLNTSGSIAAGSHTVSASDDENSTGSDTLTINGGAESGLFRITLAWTDYPGEPAAAKALVNDLDLEVIAPDGSHYYGNAGLYSAGQCLRAGQWDACNNVEGVLIPEAQAGAYTVIVHGYNVAQGPQPYALVAAGDGLQAGSGPGETHYVYLPLVTKGH